MAALNEALDGALAPGSVCVSERLTPRTALQAWRAGQISLDGLSGALERVTQPARESGEAIDRMTNPNDGGLMSRIMTTTREAVTDVIASAKRLHAAALQEAWDEAEAALTSLENAQHFLTQIGSTGALA